MSAQIKRIVPAAGSTRQPWPWHVWAALLITFAATLTVRFKFPPPVAISSARLSFPGERCAVEFEATNNTKRSITASFLVITGLSFPGEKIKALTYNETTRDNVVVRLAARESKKISSEFALPDHWRPTTARIEIASLDKQAP